VVELQRIARTFRAAWVLLALASTSAPRAHAQEGRSFALYDSPHCALRGDFADEVGRLVGPSRGAEAPIQIMVRLVDMRRGGISVVLRVGRLQGSTKRALHAATCAEANDAAVLLAALAIDPNVAPASREPLPEPGAFPDSAASVPPAVAPPTSAPLPTSAAPAAPGPNKPEPKESKLQKPAPEKPDAGARDGAVPDEASGEPGETAPAEARGPALFSSHPWLLRAAAAIDPTTLDGASFSALLELGTALKGVELAVGGSYGPATHLDRGASEAARIAITRAEANLRVGPRLGRGDLHYIPGAIARMGQFRAEPQGAEAGRAQRTISAELGVGLLAEWRLAGPIGLDVSAELALPIRRPVIVLDDDVRFRMPFLVGRLLLGVRFWSLFPR
jgi:hypothetical protein